MAETSSRRDNRERQYLSCIDLMLGVRVIGSRRPTMGVASRETRTSTVLGRLRRIGRVHSDSTRTVKRERSEQSTDVRQLHLRPCAEDRKEEDREAGDLFGCGKQLWRRRLIGFAWRMMVMTMTSPLPVLRNFSVALFFTIRRSA